MQKLLRRLFRKRNDMFSIKVLKTMDKPARIQLDGEDISDKIFGFEYRIVGTEYPRATLTFPCKSIEIESIAELSNS